MKGDLRREEMIEAEPTCKDFGDRPGCLGTPDPKYTMDFSDIGEGQILWCSYCGPDAHAMANILNEALATRGPEFTDRVRAEIEKAEAIVRSRIS